MDNNYEKPPNGSKLKSSTLQILVRHGFVRSVLETLRLYKHPPAELNECLAEASELGLTELCSAFADHGADVN